MDSILPPTRPMFRKSPWSHRNDSYRLQDAQQSSIVDSLYGSNSQQQQQQQQQQSAQIATKSKKIRKNAESGNEMAESENYGTVPVVGK